MKLRKLFKKINTDSGYFKIQIGKYSYDSKISFNGMELKNVKSFNINVTAGEVTKLDLEIYNNKLQTVKGNFKRC